MKKSALIINQQLETRTILKVFLAPKFKTTTQTNGKDAFNWLLDGNTTDLIIYDAELSQQERHGFIKQIKTSAYFKDIPVLFVEKESNESVEIQEYKRIQSPFIPEKLEQVIKSLMQP